MGRAHADMTDEYRARVHDWLRHDAGAVAFIDTLFGILHVVDDLTDQDKPVTITQVHDALWHALITLPRNAFYAANFALLNGTLQTAILNWHAANRMEVTEATNAKEVAFVLRSSYNDLITVCAWIIGGDEWARKVAYEVRLYASDEGFQAYQDSLAKERRRALIVEG